MRKDLLSLPHHVQHRLSRIHVLTHAELQRLFAVITELRDQALFLVAYRHGLRASEVSLLETGDLDLGSTRISIRRLGKKRSGEHNLQKDEVIALKRYLQSRADDSVGLFLGARGQPISRRGLDWLMKSYGNQAKLPKEKMHFHTLKHSVATHLLSAGADLRYVHEWLGHTALQNTALYVYLASPSLGGIKAHRKLPGPKLN